MKDEGRAIRHPSSIARNCNAILAAVSIAGAATAAAGIDDSKRIVDRAEPLRCEILALEAGVKAAQPGSDDAAALGARLDEAKALLKYHYLATMDEYIAVMKQLPFEERQAVYRYDHAVAERCPPR